MQKRACMRAWVGGAVLRGEMGDGMACIEMIEEYEDDLHISIYLPQLV